jgi:hypothetical protein
MRRITFTQQGIVTQYELAKILIITSNGVLEVTLPLTDDDRRDMEIHIRGKFIGFIAFQVKSTTHLHHPYAANQLSIFFSVPKDKLISHPNFWYVFGYFDMEAMSFVDPIFIVPSTKVHQHAAPHLEGDRWTFNFSASLEPDSKDQWVPDRVKIRDVGRRVLEILEKQGPSAEASALPTEVAQLDGLVVVGTQPVASASGVSPRPGPSRRSRLSRLDSQ